MHEEQDATTSAITPQTDVDGDATPAPALSHLTAAQELALERMSTGISITKAATAAGVHRRTVYRWIETDPHFAAAFNAWRAEMVASNRARALAMSDLALDTVTTAMEQGNARVALQVAKATGALKPDRPGLTDPEELRRRRELHEGRRELQLIKAEEQFEQQSGKYKEDFTDISWLESEIYNFLFLRQRAVATETPEARAVRLATPVDYTTGYNRPDTIRLFELFDTQNPVEPWRFRVQSDPPPASPPAPAIPDPVASVNTKSIGPRALPAPSPAPASAHPPAPPEPRRRRPLSPFYTSNDSDDEVADPAWTRLI